MQVSGQRVQRNAQDFKSEKERNEVAARHQNHRTERCHQEKNVEFLASLRMALEIPVTENRDGEGGRSDQAEIEQSVVVQDEEGRHQTRCQRGHKPQRSECCRYPNERHAQG